MANTVTNTRLFCGNTKVVQYVTLEYVDTASDTDRVVYDSSAVATVLGLTDTTNCKIREIKATCNVASTARICLKFDATTDVVAFTVPLNNSVDMCFDHIGGLKNTAGTGKTGDIELDATGLSAGDTITLVIVVDPR